MTFYPFAGAAPLPAPVPLFMPFAGFSGPFTLFGQPASPASLQADTTTYTMGLQFSISQGGALTAIWFFSQTGATKLPGTIALFSVSGGGAGTLIHSEAASWSGAAASGWVRAPFSSPPSLSPGVSYKGCFLEAVSGGNFYTATSHYWDTGAGQNGITNGPITAPNNAGGDGGQDTFHSGAALTYPASVSLASNYWLDVEVTFLCPPRGAVCCAR